MLSVSLEQGEYITIGGDIVVKVSKMARGRCFLAIEADRSLPIVRSAVLTVRDVESRLGLSGTNAYYHLSLMMKANVIQARNQGRTVFYAINRQLFRSLCEMLSRYAAGEGGGKERK